MSIGREEGGEGRGGGERTGGRGKRTGGGEGGKGWERAGTGSGGEGRELAQRKGLDKNKRRVVAFGLGSRVLLSPPSRDPSASYLSGYLHRRSA